MQDLTNTLILLGKSIKISMSIIIDKIYNQNIKQIAEHNADPTITYDLGNSFYTDV
jgi:hypothetical protein